MGQGAHIMQLGGGGPQARAQAAAVIAIEREQVQFQRTQCAQLFQQGHRQQAGRVRAEAVGQPAHAQRALGAHGGGRQGLHAGGNTCRALSRTGQLLARAAVFAEEGERLHGRLAAGDGLAHLCGQPIDVAPVAQPALPVEQLRGDIGFAGQQGVCVAIRIGGRFGLAGVFQRVAQPQRDARMLRGQLAGLAQQRGGVGMAALHPARAAQPGQCFGMVAAQLQRTRGRLFAGPYVTGFQLGIGQHHPGDEVGGLALHRQAQLLPLRRHAQVPAANCASSSAWCSWISRSTSVSSSPAMMLGRSYRVSPSTRWSVMRPCGKL
ncbi:hypothetical protein D3C71_1400100 [compost metagenome]